jgi:hypothetical protein
MFPKKQWIFVATISGKSVCSERTANQGFGAGFCAKVAAAQKPLVLNMYLCKAHFGIRKFHWHKGLC